MYLLKQCRNNVIYLEKFIWISRTQQSIVAGGNATVRESRARATIGHFWEGETTGDWETSDKERRMETEKERRLNAGDGVRWEAKSPERLSETSQKERWPETIAPVTAWDERPRREGQYSGGVNLNSRSEGMKLKFWPNYFLFSIY